MNSVRKILAIHDILPRKRLGQSFLKDMTVIRRIVALAGATEDETVVEIGAGLGLMTAELAQKAGKVIALEVDPRLVPLLQDRLSADKNVEIVAGDVLHYDFSTAAPEGTIKVVGNIPYHISTPILFRLLHFRRSISSMVLMFQKELADRLMANPGTREYGIPTVIVSRYASVTRELTVPPACFYPEPGVFSSVLKIVISPESQTPQEESLFTMTVRAAFSQRRKTLFNNLRAAGFAPEFLRTALAKAGIRGERRAETLTAEEFSLLTAELSAVGHPQKILDRRRGI